MADIAKALLNGVEVYVFTGWDRVPVVQLYTRPGGGRIRINLNDNVLWTGDPEID